MITKDYVKYKQFRAGFPLRADSGDGGENPRDVVAYKQNCEIVVSEFELQFRHSVHFWTNTLM